MSSTTNQIRELGRSNLGSHAKRFDLTAVLLILFGAGSFSSVALLNGYPLIAHDTGEYIRLALELSTRWNGTPFYSVFMLPLHATLTLWPVVLVQGLITSHLIYLLIRTMTGSVRPVHFAGTCIALTVFSSLPWFSGQLMPDIFTALLVLGIFLLGFATPRLHRWERTYLVLLTIGAIIVHLSHIPLSLGLLIVVLTLRWVLSRTAHLRAVGSWFMPAAPVAVAIATIVTFNTVVQGRVTLSPYGAVMPLARFIADGPAHAYLRDSCPQAGLALCNVVDDLPDDPDVFLWGGDSLEDVLANESSIMERIGGYQVVHLEARTVILGTLRQYPMWQLGSSLRNAARQFLRFGTADGLDVYAAKRKTIGADSAAFADAAMQTYFTDEFDAYASSRQLTLTWPMEIIRGVDLTAVILAALLSAVILVHGLRTRNPFSIAMFTVVLLALMGNAVITGALGTVHDRYQSRVVWLVVLYALVFLPVLVAGGRRSGGPFS